MEYLSLLCSKSASPDTHTCQVNSKYFDACLFGYWLKTKDRTIISSYFELDIGTLSLACKQICSTWRTCLLSLYENPSMFVWVIRWTWIIDICKQWPWPWMCNLSVVCDTTSLCGAKTCQSAERSVLVKLLSRNDLWTFVGCEFDLELCSKSWTQNISVFFSSNLFHACLIFTSWLLYFTYHIASIKTTVFLLGCKTLNFQCFPFMDEL